MAGDDTQTPDKTQGLTRREAMLQLLRGGRGSCGRLAQPT